MLRSNLDGCRIFFKLTHDPQELYVTFSEHYCPSEHYRIKIVKNDYNNTASLWILRKKVRAWDLVRSEEFSLDHPIANMKFSQRFLRFLRSSYCGWHGDTAQFLLETVLFFLASRTLNCKLELIKGKDA